MSTQVLKIKEQTWIKVVNFLLLFYFFNIFLENFMEKVSNILKIRNTSIQKTSKLKEHQVLGIRSFSL